MRATCLAQSYQPYFDKTACLPSGITEDMMKDRTKITPVQKRAAQALFEHTHQLNEKTRQIMEETLDRELIEQATASRNIRDPQINDLQNRLLTGKITWGEYNTERKLLIESTAQ